MASGRPVALAVALVAGSCRISADYDGTRFRCADGVCPPGFLCGADGFCGREGADAATPPAPDADSPDGAEAVDAAIPVAACGRTAAFADDFSDGVRHAYWHWSFADSGTSLSETGGHMVVTLAAGQDAAAYAGYSSPYWASLRGSRISVEIPVMASVASGAQVFLLAIGVQGNDRVFFEQERGTLYLQIRLDGTETDVATLPYDPVLHRWWQIREEGGTTSWETSPDGVSWTEQASVPTPPFIDQVRPEMGAGTNALEPAPGEVHFDNYNGAIPLGRWCKPPSQSDDFEDGAEGALWSLAWGSSMCTRSETGGAATFTPGSTATNYCGYTSATLFDLTGSEMAVEVPEVTSTTTAASTFFKAELPDESGWVEIIATGGTISFHTLAGGVDTVHETATYDRVTHRWWRIREAGGTVYWDSSPDGGAWVNRGSGLALIPLTEVVTTLGAGVWMGSPTSPGTARFDNYNRVTAP